MKKFIFELLNLFQKPIPPKAPSEPFSTDNKIVNDKYDQRIVDHLAFEFQKKHGINLHNDPLAMGRLSEAVAKAKSELLTSEKANIDLPYISADASGAKHLRVSLTRHDIESLGVKFD